jgi:hypothetical protein
MASGRFRFLCANSIFGDRIGYVDLQQVKFNDPITGVGTLTGKALVGPAQTKEILDALLVEDITAIYVEADGLFWWGGTLTSRDWNPGERCREIKVVHWKGWYSRRLLGPDDSLNPIEDTAYTFTGMDQLEIAEAISDLATTPAATPFVNTQGLLSGVTRDLTFNGSDFKDAASLIDGMANRANGFEWTIETRVNGVSRIPDLYLGLYYPHRGAAAPTLICKKTPSGGNISVEGNIAETAENRATRVWATGTGTPPDQLIVYDQDPGVDTADVLLTETVTNYSTTSVVATLADDAQQERAFRSVLTNTMQVRAYHKDLDPGTYHTGDRAQLIYQDEGVDLNLPAVRIVDIEISVNTQNAADSSLITLDLSDAQLPDTGLVT